MFHCNVFGWIDFVFSLFVQSFRKENFFFTAKIIFKCRWSFFIQIFFLNISDRVLTQLIIFIFRISTFLIFVILATQRKALFHFYHFSWIIDFYMLVLLIKWCIFYRNLHPLTNIDNIPSQLGNTLLKAMSVATLRHQTTHIFRFIQWTKEWRPAELTVGCIFYYELSTTLRKFIRRFTVWHHFSNRNMTRVVHLILPRAS